MLKRLITELGERELYDAVSQCSRCGYCEQACPTYVATGRESYSARGRNQIVRLLIEGKLEDFSSAEDVLSTCLLCSACTTACPAHVPTADIVLEGRRMIRGETHWLVRYAAQMLSREPKGFAGILRWAYRFKRWGLARLAARSRILRLMGLKTLEIATEHLDEAPKHFLYETLEKDASLKEGEGSAWAYFAPCGPNYVFPQVGEATVALLKAKKGGGKYLANGCCGLLSYNYGDLEQAREAARENIRRLEDSECPEESPVVGDCSSCVSFLKSYPQLFMDDLDWKKRAEAFSARVRDAAEVFSAQGLEPAGEGVVTYHDSCRARNGQGIVQAPRNAVQACGAYKELPSADVCCGGAGAFAFVNPEMSEDLLRKKTAHIASTHARQVVTSSTSCLIQLARGLKKYYPECSVVHLSEFLAERLPDGKGEN